MSVTNVAADAAADTHPDEIMARIIADDQFVERKRLYEEERAHARRALFRRPIGEIWAVAARERRKYALTHFWLVAMKNCATLREFIEEHDEPLLEHLRDVDVRQVLPEVCAQCRHLIDVEEDDASSCGQCDGVIRPRGFELRFHFAKNCYFDNELLVKRYLYEEEDEDACAMPFKRLHYPTAGWPVARSEG